jgi:hypothetical protein
LRYANEALPFYILHQTVIVVVGYYLNQLARYELAARRQQIHPRRLLFEVGDTTLIPGVVVGSPQPTRSLTSRIKMPS